MLVSLTEQEILILVNTIRAFRPAWDTRAIRLAVESLSTLGLNASEVAGIGITAAQDHHYRTPTGMIFLAEQKTQAKKVDQDPRFSCDICGRNERTCRKLYSDDHEFTRKRERPATIMGEDRKVMIEDLKRQYAKRTKSRDLPVVPQDRLGDAVAGRATADDQELGEGPP
jgi:hypothetical protein